MVAKKKHYSQTFPLFEFSTKSGAEKEVKRLEKDHAEELKKGVEFVIKTVTRGRGSMKENAYVIFARHEFTG